MSSWWWSLDQDVRLGLVIGATFAAFTLYVPTLFWVIDRVAEWRRR